MAFLDSREEAIYDFVKKYYQNFFSKNKFEILKKEITEAVAVIYYSDSQMVIKIEKNKNLFLVGFGQIKDALWWSLDLIRAYFKITDYKIDEDNIMSRKKVLLESFNVDDYSGNASYLITNFNRIKNTFSSENYNKTNVELEKLSLEKQKYSKGV